MATHISAELSLFQEFLANQFTPHITDGSLDDAVNAFREYQREVSELKDKLRVGVEQCDRGEAQQLDAKTIKFKLRQRLASEGI